MKNYDRLISSETSSQVYASKNPQLIADYETTVNRAGALRSTIIVTSGAWDVAKRQYANITGKTSVVIGDAIDEIRSWFGYKPAGDLGCATCVNAVGLNGLGAIQLPAAALAAVYVTGVITTGMLLNSAMSKIFVTLGANRLQRENPNMTRTTALSQAKDIYGGDGIFGSGATLKMLAVAALGAWLILDRK